MGAQPARPLRQVRFSTTFDDVVIDLADGGIERLTDLKRAERVRVAARIGIKPKYSATDKWKTDDQLNHEIRERIGHDTVGRPIPEPADKPNRPLGSDIKPVDDEPFHVLPVESALPTPPPLPVAAPTNAAAAAAQALIDALGAQQNIDEPAVRAIAQDVAVEVFAELADGIVRPTVIRLGERPEVTIEDRVHGKFADVLDMVSVGIHPYLVGPPGTGKSTLAHQVATALGREYGSISLNPQMAISQLLGFIDASGTYRSTPFRRCYETGGVFLLDEIDNGHPSSIATLNAALANGQCAFADGMVTRHDDFVCIAAANTYGTGPTAQFVGRTQLDAATLDRFARVEVGYDEELETHMVAGVLDTDKAASWLSKVRTMRSNVEHGALRVFVTPRTSLDGAKLIAIGWTERRAADAKILSGLTPDVREKVIYGTGW